jgi:hypothetical protein
MDGAEEADGHGDLGMILCGALERALRIGRLGQLLDAGGA